MLKVVDSRSDAAGDARKHLLRHVEVAQKQHAKALREAYKLIECFPDAYDGSLLRAVLVRGPLREA